MRKLNVEEYRLFESIVSATQEGILSSMTVLLREHYGDNNVISTPDYIIAKGDIPVGIVAHMDTVHRTPVQELFYDREKNVLWSPEGIGADDRAGVYSMIEILRTGLKPTLILTTDEECGAIGASALVSDFKDAPCKLNFLIELDRRGEDDCVFYDCDNEDFSKYIEQFGFKTQWGSFSDICYICPGWKIAGVNLSIGYDDEHTKFERLYLNHMFSTIDKVCNILRFVDHEKDVFEFIQATPYTGYGSFLGGSTGSFSKIYGYNKNAYGDEEEEICWDCLGIFTKDELKIINSENCAVYCKDCYNRLYTECYDCGEPFRDPHKLHLKCENCREKEDEVID